jgi:regulator of replication initiation timing
MSIFKELPDQALVNELVKRMVDENNELKLKIDKLTTQLVNYEATLGFLKDTLREIADEDFRGNRSSASVKAYQVLKKIGAYPER